jgi:hypothetical protein
MEKEIYNIQLRKGTYHKLKRLIMEKFPTLRDTDMIEYLLDLQHSKEKLNQKQIT